MSTPSSSSPMYNRFRIAWTSTLFCDFMLLLSNYFIPQKKGFNIILYLYSKSPPPPFLSLPHFTFLFALPSSMLLIISCKMSNGSQSAKAKDSHRNFVVDYRDAKYQGEISEYLRVPEGTGMLLNIDYLLVVSRWQQGLIDGPAFVLFPEGNIYHGHIKDTNVMGYNSYQVSKRNFVYSFTRDHSETLFFMDSQLNKTLTTVRMSQKEVNQLLSSHRSQTLSLNQVTLEYLDTRSKKKKMEEMQELSYSSQEDKWQSIAKITGVPVPPEFKNFKLFLKYYFNTCAPNKDTRLELTQTKDFLELKYKRAGIICRIDEKAQHQNRAQLLGYYDSYEQKCDVYRKPNKGLEPDIQECCQGHSVTFKKERPKVCLANLQNYFRKSTNFINHFVSLKYLHQIKRLYEQVFLLVEGEISSKSAQLQLQRGSIALKAEVQNGKNDKKEENVETFRKIQLSEIKNDICNRANRRKSSNKGLQGILPNKLTSFFKNQSTNSYQISQLKESFDYCSPERSKSKPIRQESTSKRPKEYLKYAQNSPSIHQRSMKREEEPPYHSRKRYSYMPLDRREEYDNSIDKNLHRTKSNLLLNQNYCESYSAQENNKYSRFFRPPHHNESIGTLAQDYEKIQGELSQEKKSKREKDRGLSPTSNLGTPTSRSPSRWNYLKGSALSRGRRGWR